MSSGIDGGGRDERRFAGAGRLVESSLGGFARGDW
jgi:hypothetical protein